MDHIWLVWKRERKARNCVLHGVYAHEATAAAVEAEIRMRMVEAWRVAAKAVEANRPIPALAVRVR